MGRDYPLRCDHHSLPSPVLVLPPWKIPTQALVSIQDHFRFVIFAL